LFVADGKLAAAGSLSSAAPTIDLGDTPVTPGLVAAHVASAGEAFPDADAAHLRATDGLAPDDGRLRSYRDAGFLTAVVAPGSANVLAGTAGAVRSADPTAPAEDCGFKIVLTGAARDNERYPASLAGQVEMVGDRLRGGVSKTDLYLPSFVRDTLLAQRENRLALVRDRRLTAYVEANSRAEVRAALRLIAEHNLRAVLLQPKQAEELADEIRRSGVPVVAGPVRPQDVEAVRSGLVALGKAGVPVAFGGGDAAELRTTAAWLVNGGLPRPVARLGLIGQPSVRFGLPASVGRLSVGDPADFVVWDGDVVNPGSRPLAVVSQGQRVGRGS
jgi:imidazolonepropionase-like amidohydrolase